MANIPFKLTSGNVKINSKDINLSDFDGYYGSSKINKVQMYGDVKNYTKTAGTMIALTGDASNELAKYVSKIASALRKYTEKQQICLAAYPHSIEIYNLGFMPSADNSRKRSQIEKEINKLKI